MSRSLAAIFAVFLIAAAEGPPLPHASGTAAGPGPGCGGGYRVARGDTLYSIARRCGAREGEIVRASGLDDPTRIEVGEELVIPRPGRWQRVRQRVPVRPAAAPPPDGLRVLIPPVVRVPVPPAPPPPPRPPRDDPSIYRFQPDDTLYSLARWSRVSLAALVAANPGIVPTRIEIGDPIRLPRGAVRPERSRMRERGPRVAAPAPRAAPPAPPAEEDADTPGPDDEDEGPQPEGM